MFAHSGTHTHSILMCAVTLSDAVSVFFISLVSLSHSMFDPKSLFPVQVLRGPGSLDISSKPTWQHRVILPKSSKTYAPLESAKPTSFTSILRLSCRDIPPFVPAHWTKLPVIARPSLTRLQRQVLSRSRSDLEALYAVASAVARSDFHHQSSVCRA